MLDGNEHEVGAQPWRRGVPQPPGGYLLRLAEPHEGIPVIKALYQAVNYSWWVLYELCMGFI